MKKQLVTAAFALMGASLGAQAAPTAFEDCPEHGFLVQTNKAKMYSVDLTTGDSAVLANSIGTNNGYNAIGFNVHDNLMYGWMRDGNQLGVVGADYDILKLGRPVGMPNAWFYIGDTSPYPDDNAHYFYKKGNNYGIYRVQLDPSADGSDGDLKFLHAEKVMAGNLLNLTIFDFAFHPTNRLLYTVDRSGQLWSIDIKANTKTMIKNLGPGSTYGAVYFDANGYLYYSRNHDGKIFRVDVEADDPVQEEYANGPKSGQNDGARCPITVVDAPVDNTPRYDYGSSPDSYKTSAAAGGPSHNTTGSNLYLGSGVDSEDDALVAPNNDNDIGENIDDGIQFTGGLVAGKSVGIRVNASRSGILAPFFDWNGDGDFDDDGETIGDIAVTQGNQIIFIDVPLTAAEGNTWARFRISSESGLGAGGPAINGEVEDYEVAVLPCECSTARYPSCDVVTLAYEDVWPNKDDYDMNDLVVYYNTEATISGTKAKAVKIEGTIAAIGASFHNGFAVRLPGVLASDVDASNIEFRVNREVVARSEVLEAGLDEAVIIITKDVWDEVDPAEQFDDSEGAEPEEAICQFYRVHADCQQPISWSFSVSVPFNSDIELADMGSLLLDPFIFGTAGETRVLSHLPENYDPINDRVLEVHLKNMSPTSAADPAYFGLAEDASNLDAGTTYQNSNGLPFAIEIGTRWAWPLERVDLLDAYPSFKDFVLSNGETNQDWYLLDNAVNTAIYPYVQNHSCGVTTAPEEPEVPVAPVATAISR